MLFWLGIILLNKQKHPIHIISYVLLTAFTLYIIVNLEFPRVGFIRFSSFDQMLMDVREDMNYGGSLNANRQ